MKAQDVSRSAARCKAGCGEGAALTEVVNDIFIGNEPAWGGFGAEMPVEDRFRQEAAVGLLDDAGRLRRR
jgi:hypothetical protein